VIFERGQQVRVEVGKGYFKRAVIVLDAGRPEVVVSMEGFDPEATRRVRRTDILLGVQRELLCVDRDGVMCALQRQASPPRPAEFAQGVWTVCGMFVSTRSKPVRRQTDCKECARLLKGG
jgi:hypothetical protein